MEDSPQKASPRFFLCLAAAVALVAAVYIGLPCYRYLSDGLIAAIRMRDSGGLYVHPNHILFPLLPSLLHKLLYFFGVKLNELESLFLWSIDCGLISAIMLMGALRLYRVSIPGILAGLGLFAFSNAIWFFSVTPNPSSTALVMQMLGLLAIAYAATSLPEPLPTRVILRIAVFISIAILGSQLNVSLLLPGAVTVMSGNGPSALKVRKLILLLLSVAAFTLTLYILAGFFFGNVRSPAEFIRWQHSYVYGERWWTSGLADSLKSTLVGATKVHLDGVFNMSGFGAQAPGLSGWTRLAASLVLKAGQVTVLVFLAIETILASIAWLKGRRRLTIQTIGIAAWLPLALFMFFWTPETIHYRILYVPGFLLFLIPHLDQRIRVPRFSFRQAWPVFLVIAIMFLSNLFVRFIPESNPLNNPYYYEIKNLAKDCTPGSVIVYSDNDEGRIRAMYADYFIGCDTMLYPEFSDALSADPVAFTTDIRRRINQGKILLIHEDAFPRTQAQDSTSSTFQVPPLVQEWLQPAYRFVLNQRTYICLVPKTPE
jgi:hypothetical protein